MAADPILLAIVPASAGLAGILLNARLGRANRSAEVAVAAERALIETEREHERRLVQTQREHMALLKERNESLAAQVLALEAKVAAYEGRPTRGIR